MRFKTQLRPLEPATGSPYSLCTHLRGDGQAHPGQSTFRDCEDSANAKRRYDDRQTDENDDDDDDDNDDDGNDDDEDDEDEDDEDDDGDDEEQDDDDNEDDRDEDHESVEDEEQNTRKDIDDSHGQVTDGLARAIGNMRLAQGAIPNQESEFASQKSTEARLGRVQAHCEATDLNDTFSGEVDEPTGLEADTWSHFGHVASTPPQDNSSLAHADASLRLPMTIRQSATVSPDQSSSRSFVMGTTRSHPSGQQQPSKEASTNNSAAGKTDSSNSGKKRARRSNGERDAKGGNGNGEDSGEDSKHPAHVETASDANEKGRFTCFVKGCPHVGTFAQFAFLVYKPYPSMFTLGTIRS